MGPTQERLWEMEAFEGNDLKVSRVIEHRPKLAEQTERLVCTRSETYPVTCNVLRQTVRLLRFLVTPDVTVML